MLFINGDPDLQLAAGFTPPLATDEATAVGCKSATRASPEPEAGALSIVISVVWESNNGTTPPCKSGTTLGQ